MRDFYIVSDFEPGYDPNKLEVSSDLESTIQQIKMTLFTRKGEVLGDPGFGVEIDKYLFEFEVDPEGIANSAKEQINTYVESTKWRDITVNPAMIEDPKNGRDVFVLLIDVPEFKNSISIFYD